MLDHVRPAAAPLRLALVTIELRPGGAERCLTNLALGLDREQFAPQVYSLAPEPSPEATQLVEMLRDAAVPVHFIGVRRKTQLFGAVRKLRAMFVQQSPQLVQSFLFHANVVCAMATHRLPAPLLGGLRVAQPQSLRQFVERRLARRFAGFVCVSQSVAEHAAISGHLPREKLHVIPNGIDVVSPVEAAPCDWSTLGIAADRCVMLFVGRLDAQKGADLLVEAATQFLPACPQHDVVIVGEGPELARLRARVERHGLASRIHFAGWRSDVASWMTSAELVVLPSRYEGMSNVLLEAMAAGKPVVATRVQGVAEVLGPLAEQQVCAANDAMNLAAAIKRICSLDIASRRALGEANCARVAETFSLRRMISAYAALFERVAREGDRP